ncbi:MAG: hypothetical protein Q8N99_04340 [Nanoarchaeota archaeon]|nr:hypothetical protein [Nanoarchaeota archaeon]
MANIQELYRELKNDLDAFPFFAHTRVRGDLNFERNSIVIEYEENPLVQQRDFYKAKGILEQKIKDFLEKQPYAPGIRIESEGPDERQKHYIKLTRIPLEGMVPEVTGQILLGMHSILKYRHFFKT